MFFAKILDKSDILLYNCTVTVRRRAARVFRLSFAPLKLYSDLGSDDIITHFRNIVNTKNENPKYLYISHKRKTRKKDEINIMHINGTAFCVKTEREDYELPEI